MEGTGALWAKFGLQFFMLVRVNELEGVQPNTQSANWAHEAENKKER